VLPGLPGVALYRFANTADVMWGYRGVHQGHNWEWVGKWAARADDVLSWLPARITAMALTLVAPMGSRWHGCCNRRVAHHRLAAAVHLGGTGLIKTLEQAYDGFMACGFASVEKAYQGGI
jgi:cobalamin biosynthesis protein CobD/CbiB